MAGSILGKDQIARINGAYPALVAHIRALLAADHSAYGLMKVHTAVECIDTTELFNIFSKLTFISPAEKRALVRAAVYEVLTSDANAARAEETLVRLADGPVGTNTETVGHVSLKSFTPTQFKLNVATTEAMQDKQAPVEAAPAMTKPSAIKVIEDLRADAAASYAQGEAERNAAVAKLRAAVAPQMVIVDEAANVDHAALADVVAPIIIPVVPTLSTTIHDAVAEIETADEE